MCKKILSTTIELFKAPLVAKKKKKRNKKFQLPHDASKKKYSRHFFFFFYPRVKRKVVGDIQMCSSYYSLDFYFLLKSTTPSYIYKNFFIYRSEI